MDSGHSYIKNQHLLDLNFNSNHPYNVKKGIICYLQDQAKAISSDTDAYQ